MVLPKAEGSQFLVVVLQCGWFSRNPCTAAERSFRISSLIEAAAVRWYEEAVEHGSAEAAARLCLMFLRGEGVPKDERSRHWFEQADQLGYVRPRRA